MQLQIQKEKHCNVVSQSSPLIYCWHMSCK